MSAVERDLALTAEVVAQRVRARLDGTEQGGDPRSRACRQKALSRVRRHERELSAWERDCAAMAKLLEARIRARADGGGNGGDERARALRREAQSRLRVQRDARLTARIGGRPPARIAIVGAGRTLIHV